jgi:hypothetical protein
MKASFELIKNNLTPMSIKAETIAQRPIQFLSVIIPEEFQENAFIKVQIVNSNIL